MATVRENLIAAKALIDTPEKWRALRINPAIYKACPTTSEMRELRFTLYQHLPERFWYLDRFESAADTTHADIMALFDRAIAALPLHEGSGS